MQFRKTMIAATALGLLAAAGTWAADKVADKADEVARLQRATDTLRSLTHTPDKGIPLAVIEGAKCIAVVPNLTKAGFVVAGKHGKGVATCRLPNGMWSAPAFFSITGGSWGAQIGIEDTHLVMMIMTNEGARHLLDEKFEVGGAASAAAGPVGRQASAGIDWKANTEILTYSRSKGLFAGVDLGGSWIERDRGATEAFYGRDLPNRDLLGGKVTPPADAREFLGEAERARTEAKNS